MSDYKDRIQQKADEMEYDLGRSLTHEEYLKAQWAVADEYADLADYYRDLENEEGIK